jgi:DNA-binding CsgD family transcriptional regulator/PAS domain-containing protein
LSEPPATQSGPEGLTGKVRSALETSRVARRLRHVDSPVAPNEEAALPLRRLASLFESAADGVYFVAPGQQIVFWNAAAERITGLPAHEALGRQCYDVIAGSDFLGRCFCRRDCNTITCVLRGVGVENYDVLARLSPARRLWLNVSIVAFRAVEYDQPLAAHLFREVEARRHESTILANDMLAAVSGNGTASVPIEVKPALTVRELEVLRLLASGASVRAIAEQMVVTRATARNHIENLMAKLNVHSRLEAVVYAAHHQLLGPQPPPPADA